jgi:hypothetical protein
MNFCFNQLSEYRGIRLAPFVCQGEMAVIPCQRYNDCGTARRVECTWEKCGAYLPLTGKKHEEFKLLANNFLKETKNGRK